LENVSNNVATWMKPPTTKTSTGKGLLKVALGLMAAVLVLSI